jgi:hypothetical protein
MATTLLNNALSEQQQQPVVVPAPEMLLHSSSLDGRSNYSSSTDMSRLNPDFDPNDDLNRSHHLLKHCLSNGQRNEALLHFATDDVKEAAKEISKMGQRDLQGKFRLVYGTATHSNNNDWLRRKLYEAIGAAPIKATTKTKPRKTTSSKPKKASPPLDPLYHTSSAAPSVSGGDMMGERRSRRTTKGVHSSRNVGITTIGGGGGGGLSVAESLKRYRMGSGSLPGSPVVGRSVIDMNRYLGHESATTSVSEDEAGAWGSNRTRDGESAAGDGHGEQGGRYAIRRRASADDYLAAVNGAATRPQSAFAPASRSMDLPAVPPHLRRPSLVPGAGVLPPQTTASLLARRASSAGLVGFSTLNLEMFQNTSDVWSSDAWADAALKAAAARKAPVAAPSPEDEDVMMLPVDLSAFEEDGASLLWNELAS